MLAYAARARELPPKPIAVLYDPYRRCEEDCRHDCGPGVLTSDLLGGAVRTETVLFTAPSAR